MQTAAIFACSILGFLGLFQLALASGAPLGQYAWGGQHRTLPIGLRIGSVLSPVVYGGLGLVLLAKAGLVGGSLSSLAGTGAWIVFGYFSLGVAINAISRSMPERAVMTPVAALLAVLSLVVALG